MAKYSKKIVERIASLIETDSYTIAEVCQIVGIHKDTYYSWLNEKADFSDAIEKAKRAFDEMLVKEAKRSLVKMVKGYSAEEVKTVYIEDPKAKDKSKPKIKEQTKIIKHFQPNPTLVIFSLTNKAPDEYKNRQSIDAKGDFNHNIGFGDFLMSGATIDEEPEGGGDEVQE